MSARRPPLPPGPWLVVGLARSGAAAARALWARGEPVIGVDAGEPPEAQAAARRGHRDLDRRRRARRAAAGARRREEPGRAARGAGDRAPRASRACRCSASWSSAGGCRTPVRRRHRHERQDDDVRAARRDLARRRAARSTVAGNVGTAVSSLDRPSRRGDRDLRGEQLPARGHAWPSRRRSPCC